MLKLEINERLQIGSDELVDNKDADTCDNDHQPDGHQSEIETIPTFTTDWQPVDYHANDKQNKNVSVFV